jgi:hypothetical protein
VGCSPRLSCAARLCAGSHEASRGERYIAPQCFVLLFGSTHGTGKASTSVRVDRQFQSKLVLRFNAGRCGVNHLSPVKLILYLRLKSFNPRRHRPIRQSRGAPTVLSECDNEDRRCCRCGHFSLSARRPQRRHHLCALQQKFRLLISRSLSSLFVEQLCMSHCVDSSVVAMELQARSLGPVFPMPCTLFSLL